MSSKAYKDFTKRIDEVNLLMQAHEALVKFHRAKSITNKAMNVQQVIDLLRGLAGDVGPGRPPQIEALNKAAIAMLCGHLQGYIVDLFIECANRLLTGKIADVGALIEEAPTKANPNADNISRLFGILGFKSIMQSIQWPNMSNASVKGRLRDLNELRNKIVHGASVVVRKERVRNYLGYTKKLIEAFDQEVHRRMKSVLKQEPW